MIQKIDKTTFGNSILMWYKKNKRDLPWRRTKDPYKIWISEIILQQTRINQGIHYYINFINTFPDINSLAKSNKNNVLKTWEGLGYYSRAINILDNARKIVSTKKRFPKNFKELLELKGVGEYTASAISSICFNEKRGAVDGNVFRVLSRIFNIQTPINTVAGKKEFIKLANMLIPDKNVGDYNQALMDFGSIQCMQHAPKCKTCIFQKCCLALNLGTIKDLPVKKKNNTKKKYRILNYFLIEHKSHLYIRKRMENIWKNLYELPLIESEKIIKKNHILKQKVLNKTFSTIKINNISLSKTMSHHLSHQKIDMFFWKINASNISLLKNSEFEKISIKEIKNYPFPIPIKIYLNELFS